MAASLLSLRPRNFTRDSLSGLTVALALVPEAIAFAFVAGLPPMVALHAAVIVGLIAAIFGGRPGMISGATGAMAVVLIGLVLGVKDKLGLPANAEWSTGVVLAYVCAAVALAGVLQISAGVLRLGKFIRLVPHPVMLGFVNGLAIVICRSQFHSFKTPDGNYMSGGMLYWMIGLVAITMAVIVLTPKLTKHLPAPLAGIGIATALSFIPGLESLRIGDLASIAGSWPTFVIPGFSHDVMTQAAAAGIELPTFFSLETLKIILPYSIILASVGLIESLMTMTLIDEITESRGRGNRECIGQGLANLICGFFNAMGGCAMIGQSMINIQSGGRGRTSGIVAALILLAFILVGAPIIESIPVAALTGVMFMVVIGTFAWSSLKMLHRVPKSDAIIIIAVTAITVITDNLALAVACGVIVAALAFAWKQAESITITSTDDADKDGQPSRTYNLRGLLFFASVTQFQQTFDPANDPEDVVLDFANAKVLDHSAIEAINALTERYQRAGKKLHMRHLSADCRKLLDRAATFIEVNHAEDPIYKVADDALG